MSETKADLLLDIKTKWGEEPTYDERTNIIMFVDIEGHHIYGLDATNHSPQWVISTPEDTGTIALTENKDIILAALKKRVVEVDLVKKEVGRTVAELPDDPELEKLRFNDGKASPGGVFIVGMLHLEWNKGGRSRLYKMTFPSGSKDGKFELLLGPEKVQVSNGMVWNTEKKLMYYNDTGKRTITAYATDDLGVPTRESLDKGGEKVIVTTDPNEGFGPDGLTKDSNLNPWAVILGGGKVVNFDAQTGERLHTVTVAARGTTAPTFGGKDLTNLYITTMPAAPLGYTNEPDPHGGAVFIARSPGGAKGANPAYKVKMP